MARLNISIPEHLKRRLEKHRGALNVSQICQEALKRELTALEALRDNEKGMTMTQRLERQSASLREDARARGRQAGIDWAIAYGEIHVLSDFQKYRRSPRRSKDWKQFVLEHNVHALALPGSEGSLPFEHDYEGGFVEGAVQAFEEALGRIQQRPSFMALPAHTPEDRVVQDMEIRLESRHAYWKPGDFIDVRNTVTGKVVCCLMVTHGGAPDAVVVLDEPPINEDLALRLEHVDSTRYRLIMTEAHLRIHPEWRILSGPFWIIHGRKPAYLPEAEPRVMLFTSRAAAEDVLSGLREVGMKRESTVAQLEDPVAFLCDLMTKGCRYIQLDPETHGACGRMLEIVEVLRAQHRDAHPTGNES